MRITSAERQKKNKERISVWVDGNYEFSIMEEDYLRLGLYEDKELTREDIDYIKDSVNFNSAKYAAIKILSLKIRTAKEVENKLEEKGYARDTTHAVIEELKAMGYLNDTLYVQKYIFDRNRLKPKSKKLLKLELQGKGIDTQTIDDILQDMELDEDNLAESLIRKKFGKYDLSDEKVMKKAYAFLQHRGFEFSLIEKAVRKAAEKKSE